MYVGNTCRSGAPVSRLSKVYVVYYMQEESRQGLGMEGKEDRDVTVVFVCGSSTSGQVKCAGE